MNRKKGFHIKSTEFKIIKTEKAGMLNGIICENDYYSVIFSIMPEINNSTTMTCTHKTQYMPSLSWSGGKIFVHIRADTLITPDDNDKHEEKLKMLIDNINTAKKSAMSLQNLYDKIIDSLK